MKTTRTHMIQIAVLVTGFAVGMAGLLNYFKYRATAERLVVERLAFTGQQIENTIQSSLALGLQFNDLGTLPATLQRLLKTDNLTIGIDVFDTDGHPLYSTDPARAKQPVPPEWLEAARRAHDDDWHVREGDSPAVGSAIQTQFGLTIGHAALRYSEDRVRAAASVVAREIALIGAGVFVVAAVLASLAMLAVMKSLERDAARLEAALKSGDPTRAAASGRGGPFAEGLRRFVDTVRSAENQITDLRAQLRRGDAR